MSLAFMVDEMTRGLTGMARKLHGIRSRLDDRIVQAVSAAGEHIVEAAQARAPRDTGALEGAIDYKLIRRVTDRSYTVVVFVDDTKTRNKKGADYSGFAHDQIQPAGPKGLGERSQDKQSASSVEVGGDFIVRAMSDEAQGAKDVLFSTLRGFFR